MQAVGSIEVRHVRSLTARLELPLLRGYITLVLLTKAGVLGDRLSHPLPTIFRRVFRGWSWRSPDYNRPRGDRVRERGTYASPIGTIIGQESGLR